METPLRMIKVAEVILIELTFPEWRRRILHRCTMTIVQILQQRHEKIHFSLKLIANVPKRLIKKYEDILTITLD